MRTRLAMWAALAAAWPMAAVRGGAVVTVAVERGGDATAKFEVGGVPAPSATDAANEAEIRIIAGAADPNGAGVACLNDGRLPQREDDPGANFFFAAGSSGGRLAIDLRKPTAVQQVNTFSWHPNARGPQVYKLYAAGDEAGFDVRASGEGDPAERGWALLAEVDARGRGAVRGGQYAVSIADAAGGTLATARYLLLVVDATESDDPFGNTFYSEIDVVDGRAHAPAPQPAAPELQVLRVADKYDIEFDVSEMPELQPWVDETLKPVCREWYPKIVGLLPSEGYAAPERFRISFRKDMPGVAHCAGTRIECAGSWFMNNRDGEAAGAVVHEMVHVVQQYGGGRRGHRNPGWLVEGLADYIRWFLYEPAELRPRVNPARAKYTDSYRTTGAFLDYLVREHDEELVVKLNAAMRRGEFRDALWKDSTGKTVDELWAEFVATLQ